MRDCKILDSVCETHNNFLNKDFICPVCNSKLNYDLLEYVDMSERFYEINKYYEKEFIVIQRRMCPNCSKNHTMVYYFFTFRCNESTRKEECINIRCDNSDKMKFIDKEKTNEEIYNNVINDSCYWL